MNLSELDRKQSLKLLAITALSDGYIHFVKSDPSSIRLSTKEYCLNNHDFLHVLIKKLGKHAKTRIKNGIVITEIYSRELIRELFNLSPTFKTSPHNETRDEYEQKGQPTISFLSDEDETFKWLVLSLWFDFDGSISPLINVKRKAVIKGNKIYRYYQVQAECQIQIAETNPNVVKELSKLLNNLEIRNTIRKDKRNWSGIEGILISNKQSVINFIDNYISITSVKVSKKSPRFHGIEKYSVMLGVYNFLKHNRLSYHYENKDDADKKKAFLTSLLQKNIEENAQPRRLAAKEGVIP